MFATYTYEPLDWKGGWATSQGQPHHSKVAWTRWPYAKSSQPASGPQVLKLLFCPWCRCRFGYPQQTITSEATFDGKNWQYPRDALNLLWIPLIPTCSRSPGATWIFNSTGSTILSPTFTSTWPSPILAEITRSWTTMQCRSGEGPFQRAQDGSRRSCIRHHVMTQAAALGRRGVHWHQHA